MISAKCLFLLILFSSYVLISFCKPYFFDSTIYYLSDYNICNAEGKKNVLRFEENSTHSIEVIPKFSWVLHDFYQIKLNDNFSCTFKVQADKNSGIYVEVKDLYLINDQNYETCTSYIQFRGKNQTSYKMCGIYKNRKNIEHILFNLYGSGKVTTDFIDEFGDIEVTVHIHNNQLTPAEKISMLFTQFYKCDLGNGNDWMCNSKGCIIFNQFNTIDRYNFTDNCPCENCMSESGCTLKPNLTSGLVWFSNIPWLRLNYSSLERRKETMLSLSEWVRPNLVYESQYPVYPQSPAGLPNKNAILYTLVFVLSIFIIIMKVSCWHWGETSIKGMITEEVIFTQGLTGRNNEESVLTEEVAVRVIIFDEPYEERVQEVIEESTNVEDLPPEYTELPQSPQPPQYNELFDP